MTRANDIMRADYEASSSQSANKANNQAWGTLTGGSGPMVRPVALVGSTSADRSRWPGRILSTSRC